MRFVAIAVVLSAFSLGYPCARASDNANQTPDALAALEAKANQAQPRDRCFLYAELVSRMTEIAGQEMDSDPTEASATLKQVQQYATMIHQGVNGDSRRLKKAEILVQRTSFHLKDILDSASYENRQIVESTLSELNQIQSQLMMAVFKK